MSLDLLAVNICNYTIGVALSTFIIFDHLSPIFLELIVVFAIACSLLFVVEIVSNMFKLTIKFRIHSLYNNLNLVLIANSLL